MVQPYDPRTRTFDPDSTRTPSAAQPPASSAARPSAPLDSAPAPALPRNGVSPAALASAAVAASAGKRDADISARLDDYRAAMSGPYFVNGRPVTAAPHFRMNGGGNQRQMEQHLSELRAIAIAAHCESAVGPATAGRPTPDQLRAITQALIDAGKIPDGPEPLGDRIRRMAWEFGVGIDCAGYAQQAFLAAISSSPRSRSDAGFRDVMNENLGGLGANVRFAAVAPSAVRAGDVITLASFAGGDEPGHSVIVCRVQIATPEYRARIADKLSQDSRSQALRGDVRVITVDSSWGAGADGDLSGGVQRHTWLYFEATKKWGSGIESGAITVSAAGPYDHRLVGIYHWRGGS